MTPFVRNVSLFLGFGLVWLFLFSLPVGKGKSLYGVLHYYLVDTRPVHWAVDRIQGSYDATLEATDTASDAVGTRSQETLTQGSEMLRAIE